MDGWTLIGMFLGVIACGSTVLAMGAPEMSARERIFLPLTTWTVFFAATVALKMWVR